jgi:hypothetical protein
LGDSGPLPTNGGALETSLLNANVPGLLTAEVLHASTVGQGNRSRSEASVANLNLTVGNSVVGTHSITAGFLMSRATAACNNGMASVSGDSEIAELVVDGQAIDASVPPNTTILLPPQPISPTLAKIVINEQILSGNNDITVNALHVTFYDPSGNQKIADVIISSAHADITCAVPPPPPPPPGCPGSDFVTGGGWITGTPSGAKGNFGVAGGMKNGVLWGHLTYIDHGPNGPKVKGTGVTQYVVTGLTTRHIEGTCEVNGQGGFTYRVDVADNGEPGRSDTFSLNLSNGYSASGNLAGGNIQLHQPCQ